MQELKFIEFKKIVESNGMPAQGFYLVSDGGMEVSPVRLSYWEDDPEDLEHTVEFWGDRKFLCLDGCIVDLASLVEKSDIEIKWAPVLS